jgi:hypothetical protein
MKNSLNSVGTCLKVVDTRRISDGEIPAADTGPPLKKDAFARSRRSYLRACKNELERGDGTEATVQLEARIAATLANTGKQVQSLFTLVHAQFAITNSLLQYVLTCVVEPPEDVLPAARARAKARYAKILRLAGQEVATRNKATLEEVLTQSKQQ